MGLVSAVEFDDCYCAFDEILEKSVAGFLQHSDEDLMDLARDNDDGSALNELIDRRDQDTVRPACRAQLQGYDESFTDEASQETWIRVWRGRHTWSREHVGPSEFRGWVGRIARNAAHDVRKEWERGPSRHRTHEEIADESIEDSSSRGRTMELHNEPASHDYSYDYIDFAEILIEQLRAHQDPLERRVIVLYYFSSLLLWECRKERKELDSYLRTNSSARFIVAAVNCIPSQKLAEVMYRDYTLQPAKKGPKPGNQPTHESVGTAVGLKPRNVRQVCNQYRFDVERRLKEIEE